MKDLHDVVIFPYEGKRIPGLVLKHYDHPLNDFYIIYAEHSLFEYTSDDDCKIITSDAILPACDAALTDYKLKRQNIQNIAKYNTMVNDLMDAMQNMNIDNLLT